MTLEPLYFYFQRHKVLIGTILLVAALTVISYFRGFEALFRFSGQYDLAWFFANYNVTRILLLCTSILLLILVSLALFESLESSEREKVGATVNQELSKLRQDNQSLIRNLEACYSVMDQAPAGICLTREGKLQVCNEAMMPFWCIPITEAIDKNLPSLFYFPYEIKAIVDKCMAALKKGKTCVLQQPLTLANGDRALYQVSAFPMEKNHPDQGTIWLFQDYSARAWNIELEKYYQTVFRALSLLHSFNDQDDEYELLRQILNEIIGIYGLKTAFFLTYHNKHLKVKFIIGDDQDFPDVKCDINLNDKNIQDVAVVKAYTTKHAVGYSDIHNIPYYKESFRRRGKRAVLSTYAFPIIIENRVEGVISMYGDRVGFFSNNLIFRLQQLLSEICENIGIIRLRRRSQLAIHQYEERLRSQIQELEANKKIMQDQAVILKEARITAENANRMKSEFIANMSHELRTPLNAIIGFSEVMTTETLGPMPEKYHEYVKYIFSSGQYLLSLINDILDLSSLEGGHKKMLDVDIDILPFLKSIIEVIRHYPGGDKRDIQYHITPENMIIRIDERSLKQIMLNLLSNAIKFTDDGGKITVDIGLNSKKDIQISVTDNGIGVPEDKIKDLFQPFTQIENVMTRKHKGTGLGLALVRRLCELNQGSVRMESQLTKGTRLIVTLPKSRYIKPAKGKKA